MHRLEQQSGTDRKGLLQEIALFASDSDWQSREDIGMGFLRQFEKGIWHCADWRQAGLNKRSQPCVQQAEMAPLKIAANRS